MSVSLNATDVAGAEARLIGELTDEELLLEYRRSEDREAFAELVRRYERELYSYLRRLLGSMEDAEDAFQAAFLQVHLKCDQFQLGRRVRPWLYAIATNQAIDAHRRERSRHASRMQYLRSEAASDRLVDEALVSREPDPADEADRLEMGERLEQALVRLSEPMRLTVCLVYFQGMKYREAAEVLSVPVGTIKSRLNAAIARLSEFLGQDVSGLGDRSDE